MATSNTDFLKFNAYSIKELITRKLSENSAFTDLIYEGSNLAILIDLVSYMYQCLTYQLNNAAAESMFADTQIYENISRLVRLLGYNPKGCYPASTAFTLTRPSSANAEKLTLPRYSYIDTGLTDSNGKQICFSTAEDKEFDTDELIIDNVQFFNGKWKMYPTVFTATGSENETFELLNIASNSEQLKFVSHDHIHVYVLPYDEINTNNKLKQWTQDNDGIFIKHTNETNLILEQHLLYGNEDTIYSVKLLQDKTYQLVFGDGITGMKLGQGDQVFVFYLDTNGYEGEIDLSDIDFNGKNVKHGSTDFKLTSSMYERIFGKVDMDSLKNISIDVDNFSVGKFTAEQNVESIRTTAPDWFKFGNRLITRKDYEYFVMYSPLVRSVFPGLIIDAKCMNNIEYMSTFYKWLYLMGTQHRNDGRHYFNLTFWNRTDFKEVDPADANNTYVWIKTSKEGTDYNDEYDVTSVEKNLNNQIMGVKTMTTEMQVLKPVIVKFDICACPDVDIARQLYLEAQSEHFDDLCDSYIEVTLDDNTLYVGNQLDTTIYNIIVDAFDINKCKMGLNVDCSEIMKKLYQISGVQRIRTIWLKDGFLSHAADGIAFASWSPVLDDSAMKGVDLTLGNTTRHIEGFLFPVFAGKAKLRSRIKVIKKSLTAINTIKM